MAGEPVSDLEEVAAIVAAIEVLTAEQQAPPPSPESPRWRFSGRSWAKPVPLSRERPWA